MPKTNCPACSRKVRLPDYVVEATVRCPSCSQFFRTGNLLRFSSRQPPPALHPAAERGEPDGPPLLTGEHQCQHCGSLITFPAGRASATVDCPACGNKTSVYAVLHRCPTCRRLLESPTRRGGAETACPGCSTLLRIPRDVLRTEAPASPEEFWFGCYCPNCEGEVATREKDVGVYAVCPHCLLPFDVPHAGHYLEGVEPLPAPDPLDVLHASKELTCTACGTRFPARSPACPVCGSPPPSPSSW